jgi:Mg2+ and Co2+ transporter CorA
LNNSDGEPQRESKSPEKRSSMNDYDEILDRVLDDLREMGARRIAIADELDEQERSTTLEMIEIDFEKCVLELRALLFGELDEITKAAEASTHDLVEYRAKGDHFQGSVTTSYRLGDVIPHGPPAQHAEAEAHLRAVKARIARIEDAVS